MLIDNLLAFSRMGRCPASGVDQYWDLVAKVREELFLIPGRIIEWKIEACPGTCRQNPLQQVWMNLLGNADQYTRNATRRKSPIGCKESQNEFEFYVKTMARF